MEKSFRFFAFLNFCSIISLFNEHIIDMETAEFKAQLQQAILRSDIVKIFDNLLTIAVEEGASDIHIEPLENYSRIRLRIDGVLQELIQYPRSLHESVISKFKIES